MKLTKKLKVANAIYESDMSPAEKITKLNCIKNLNEVELNDWLESEKINEGIVWPVVKYGTAALIGAAAVNAIRKRLDSCISTCRTVYKQTGDKERYSKCLAACNGQKEEAISKSKK